MTCKDKGALTHALLFKLNDSIQLVRVRKRAVASEDEVFTDRYIKRKK